MTKSMQIIITLVLMWGGTLFLYSQSIEASEKGEVVSLKEEILR